MNKKKTIIWTLLTVLAYLPIFARHEIVKESIPIGYIVWGGTICRNYFSWE